MIEQKDVENLPNYSLPFEFSVMKRNNRSYHTILIPIFLSALLFWIGCDQGEKAPNTNPPASEQEDNEPEAPQASDLGVVDRDEVCKDVHNSQECAVAIENAITAIYPELIEPSPGDLKISLLNGGSKSFANTIVPEGEETTDAYTYHRIVEYYPTLELVLIEIQYYEGGEYLLFSRKNGEMEKVFEEPHFSPDQKHFATFSEDMIAGYHPNGYEIWRLEEAGLKRVAFDTPENWSPASIEWLDNGSIEIERYELDFENNLERKSIPSLNLKMDASGSWK